MAPPFGALDHRSMIRISMPCLGLGLGYWKLPEGTSVYCQWQLRILKEEQFWFVVNFASDKLWVQIKLWQSKILTERKVDQEGRAGRWGDNYVLGHFVLQENKNTHQKDPSATHTPTHTHTLQRFSFAFSEELTSFFHWLTHSIIPKVNSATGNPIKIFLAWGSLDASKL